MTSTAASLPELADARFPTSRLGLQLEESYMPKVSHAAPGNGDSYDQTYDAVAPFGDTGFACEAKRDRDDWDQACNLLNQDMATTLARLLAEDVIKDFGASLIQIARNMIQEAAWNRLELIPMAASLHRIVHIHFSSDNADWATRTGQMRRFVRSLTERQTIQSQTAPKPEADEDFRMSPSPQYKRVLGTFEINVDIRTLPKRKPFIVCDIDLDDEEE